jgi:hypothetical protein
VKDEYGSELREGMKRSMAEPAAAPDGIGPVRDMACERIGVLVKQAYGAGHPFDIEAKIYAILRTAEQAYQTIHNANLETAPKKR